ncbi:hypothetical protein AAY473_013631 [Plecturocebus cupreus]
MSHRAWPKLPLLNHRIFILLSILRKKQVEKFFNFCDCKQCDVCRTQNIAPTLCPYHCLKLRAPALPPVVLFESSRTGPTV